MRLTAKERVLLHLLEFVRYLDDAEVPWEMTQEGIAKAAWIDLPHLSQYLRPLRQEDHVRERTAHVQGGRRRRKVYDLTASGKLTAIRIREKVRSEVVRVRDANGLREATVSQAQAKAGPHTALLDVVRQVDGIGFFDMAVGLRTSPGTYIEMLADAPKVAHFVGRSRELEAITREAGEPRVFVVRGVAGIGKSSVAVKACEILRGKRNLFWHRVRPWDTRESILASVGEFLVALGKPGLQAVLRRGESGRAGRILSEDLRGSRACLVFDDAHEASPEAMQFFRILAEAIATSQDACALILTRRALTFYNRRDVVLLKLVEEFDLTGLESQEAAAYFSSEGLLRLPPEVVRMLRGHPLLLELARAHRTLPGRVVRDVRRYIEEEIYGELSEAERGMMKAASLYRVPVPEVVLFADPAWSHSVLLSLQNRSLIRSVGQESFFEVHDAIQEVFMSLLTPSEKRVLAAHAIDQLRSLAEKAVEEHRYTGCIDFLSNALTLSESPSERANLAENLGDANRRIGDILAVLVAYREGLRHTKNAESLARLHRKMATVLVDWGDLRSASREVEAGLRVLGDILSVERGWLKLAQSRVAQGLVERTITDAIPPAEEALRIFQEFNEISGQAQALLERGKIAAIGWPPDKRGRASEYYQSALEQAHSLADSELAIRIHLAMAIDLMYAAGEIEQAKQHLAAVQDESDGLRDPQTLATFKLTRARVNCYGSADFLSASADLKESIEAARRIRDDATIAFAEYVRSYIAFCGGSIAEAGRGFELVAEDEMRLGHLGSAFHALNNAGVCCLMRSDLSGFRRVLSAFESLKRMSNARYLQIFPELLAALDRMIQGDPTWEDPFKKALKFADIIPPDSFDFISQVPRVHVEYAAALRALGRPDADIHAQRAFDLLRSRNLHGMLAYAMISERQLADGLSELIRIQE